MQAKVQVGFSSPQNILTRDSSVFSPPLSATKKSIDGLVSSFVDQATEWRSLTAMMVGGLAYRWGKMGVMASELRAYGRTPLQVLSIAVGLGSEVTAFEITNRTLQTFRAHGRAPLQNPSPNLWSWIGPGGLKDGWLTSLVSFATLKGFGKLGETQNLVLQHGLQDIGMISGHHLLHRVGLGPKPEGTLAEQLAHAEATNLQLGTGMGLGHALSGGRILGLEKSLELFPVLRFPSEFFGGEKFRSGLVFSSSANTPPPFYGMMATGSSKTGGSPPIETSSIEAKRVTLRQWTEERKIAPDTYLGHRFSKGYKKIAEVEEALEILFGDSKAYERPLQEIDWIESYKMRGGYGRIRSYLQHREPGIRFAALQALTTLGPSMQVPELTDLLVPYLPRGNDFTQEEVAEIEAITRALSFFGVSYETLEGKTRPYLRILVNHPNREVSGAAEAVSVQLKIIPVVPDYRMLLRNQLPEMRAQALNILKVIQPFEYEPYLYECLNDPEANLRILAAEVLTQFGGAKVVRHLAELLKTDEHPEVQFMAARLLGELNSTLALGALLEVLEKPSTASFVREAILNSLGKLRRWENGSYFRSFLTHPHLEVAFAAARGLAQLGILEGIVLHYQVALQSPHDFQRRQALEALLELPKKIAKPLIDKIERDHDCTLQKFLIDSSAENRRLTTKLLDRYQPGWDKKLAGHQL